MIRHANINDVEEIVKIIDQAKAYLKSKNIDQWQHGYPNDTDVINDINNGHGYVLVDDRVVGYAAIIYGHDDNYDYIEDGKWLNEDKYGVIHRICIDDSLKGKGLASEFFEYATDRALELGFNNLRVDTHPENMSMQRLIGKNGFIKCGIVYMSDKTSRYAYQKVLK
ncbi:MAG: GNAT family N-acetyltransferase [Firmicutes bacterium]|nr:GNAT family N-acetyltransferase [Bacillota bacterium]